MCARPGIMLVLVMLCLAASTSADKFNFNITGLSVPETVAPDQQEVEIGCTFVGQITVLNWYQGHYEFFRFHPVRTPSTLHFPILGVGTVELKSCGPTWCRLILKDLTQQATGRYQCIINRAEPPYGYEKKAAHMEVLGHEHCQPLLEGVTDFYGVGDIIEAHCRGGPKSELRWYINSLEMIEFRGETTLRIKSYEKLFIAYPPRMIVQCADFRKGKRYRSSHRVTYLLEDDDETENKNVTGSCAQLKDDPEKCTPIIDVTEHCDPSEYVVEKIVQNEAIVITGHLGFLSIVLYFLIKVFYV